MISHIGTHPCGCKIYKDFIYTGKEWTESCYKCHPNQVKFGN